MKQVAARAAPCDRETGGSTRASFQLGELVVDIDSTYRALVDEFLDAYGDCEVVGPKPIAPIGCSARIVAEQPSLVCLQFRVPPPLPHLAEIALRVIRPRTALQHFSLREFGPSGWRWIENSRDPEAPLLAADATSAIVDVDLAPPEFIVNLIVGVAQLVQRSVYFVHAGGVSIDGRGVLLVGGSGTGKSTTTVALASRGNALLGDETVGLKTDPREILPFRRTIKLRPGPRPSAVAERLHRLPHGTRIDGNGIECAWIRPGTLFPDGAAAGPAPLSHVFFLRSFAGRASAGPFAPSLERLDELRPLTMTLSAVVSWPTSAAERLLRFCQVIDLFSKSRCYHLDLGSPDQTAGLIEKTVRDHAA